MNRNTNLKKQALTKELIIFLLTILFSCPSYANLDLTTWKGTYYHSIPNRIGISKSYCKEHTPGTFIHTVKDALIHPIITDKGIKLDHASFHIDKVEGVYLIHGLFLATGKSKGVQWKEYIYYYLYKFSEMGITKGIWYTNNCKGLYKGIVINKKRHKSAMPLCFLINC